jgi:hypothetical protein
MARSIFFILHLGLRGFEFETDFRVVVERWIAFHVGEEVRQVGDLLAEEDE